MDKDKFEKAVSKLRPGIERLVREVEESPESCISGFVFTTAPTGIIKFGNVANRGDDLIRLHLALSTLSAEMVDGSPWVNLQYADVAMGDKPVGQAPEEIADALARAVLVTGLETGHAAQALELAQRYIQARHTPEKSGQ